MIAPLPAGSEFAGYQVESVLARGGMGVVYLATQLRPHRRIALKLIAPALADDPAYRERFLREVDALAALEHPNVVPIHAAGEWEGRLYLAMRYLDGPDLAEVVRTRGPLAPAEAVALLVPIADAIDVAHARGIVHRDVTPSNIRLDGRGVPYLMDFGLTRVAAPSAAAQPSEPMGTPSYMAPELATAGGVTVEADPALVGRSDVYALGCVLVTVLTGTPPYPRDTYEATLQAHANADPPLVSERRPGLPRAIDAVIGRALAKDPAARFATAGALMAAARIALQDVAPPATVPAERRSGSSGRSGPSGSPGRVGRVGRSRLATLARAAALVVLLGAGALAVGTGLLLAGSSGLTHPGASAGPSLAGVATPRPVPSRPPAASTAPPTASPVPTTKASPASTPAATAAPRFGTAANVNRLTAWVPPAVRDSCVSEQIGSPVLLAALRCKATDAKSLRYLLYSSTATLTSYWNAFVAAHVPSSGGRCAAGEPAAGTWNDEGLLGFFGARRGSVACTVQGGDARVDWTTVDAPIWTTLWREDQDLAAAYATWSVGTLNPLREPR